MPALRLVTATGNINAPSQFRVTSDLPGAQECQTSNRQYCAKWHVTIKGQKINIAQWGTVVVLYTVIAVPASGHDPCHHTPVWPVTNTAILVHQKRSPRKAEALKFRSCARQLRTITTPSLKNQRFRSSPTEWENEGVLNFWHAVTPSISKF